MSDLGNEVIMTHLLSILHDPDDTRLNVSQNSIQPTKDIPRPDDASPHQPALASPPSLY